MKNIILSLLSACFFFVTFSEPALMNSPTTSDCEDLSSFSLTNSKNCFIISNTPQTVSESFGVEDSPGTLDDIALLIPETNSHKKRTCKCLHRPSTVDRTTDFF